MKEREVRMINEAEGRRLFVSARHKDLLDLRHSLLVFACDEPIQAPRAYRHGLEKIALQDEAGLDEAAWALDWFPSEVMFRTIRIFPSSAS
jgi:hypothetical protein